MAQVFTHIVPFEQRVYDYCYQRRCELESIIGEAQRELEFFVELQKRQDRCPNCGGKGHWSVCDIENESHYEHCTQCGGTGARTL